MESHIPYFIDVFLSPVRDNHIAQVATLAVMMLILLDILFGVLNALIKHEFDSSTMREGLGHKCTEIGMLIVGIIADACFLSGFDIGYSAPIFTAIAGLICVFEIGSLLETFAEMNPALAGHPVFKLLAASQELLTRQDAAEGDED